MSEYELYHYGIKGMKWGVRRKRNMDAKAAGKAAYKKSISESKSSPDSKKLGSGRKALNAARKAKDEAVRKSLYDSASPRQKARMDAKKNLGSEMHFKNSKRLSKMAVASYAASSVLNSIGKKMYSELNGQTTPAGVAVLRGTGYAAKALQTVGKVSVVASAAERYRGYTEWKKEW